MLTAQLLLLVQTGACWPRQAQRGRCYLAEPALRMVQLLPADLARWAVVVGQVAQRALMEDFEGPEPCLDQLCWQAVQQLAVR